VEFIFQNRQFKKSLKQIMVVPAFAITTDKSQGTTVSASIIGSQKDSNRKGPPNSILYVALSRVTDPSKMTLTEPLTMDLVNQFKPSEQLIEIDTMLKGRSRPEFYNE
jgi:hypothetical protein